MTRNRLDRILIKILLPLIWIGLVALAVCAQPFPKRLKLPKSISHEVPADLSAQLSRRVKETYRHAMQVQSRYPVTFLWTAPSRRYRYQHLLETNPMLLGRSVQSGQMLVDFLPTDVYPHASFLKPEHLPDYFLAKHNLEIQKWLPKLAESEEEFARRIDDFYAAKQTFTHPAEEDMAWLAGQLTPEHRYLLLGEEHDLPQARQEVANLITQLGKSGREVIVFTEFLYNGQIWSEQKTTNHLKQYLPVWQAAEKAGVEVIGLEPKFMENIFGTRLMFARRYKRIAELSTDIWTSVEGLRIRNACWLETLQRYRALYPQALFVIYAGAGHVEYRMPYSLGDALGGPQTVVALFNSQDLDWAFGDLPDRIFKFNDPELSHLVGFDIAFELSPNIK